MGSELLNHLRVTVLPLPKADWAGGSYPRDIVMARSPLVSQHGSWHGLRGFWVSAGTRKCVSVPLVVRIWSISPRAVTEVELLALSNWMLT